MYSEEMGKTGRGRHRHDPKLTRPDPDPTRCRVGSNPSRVPVGSSWAGSDLSRVPVVTLKRGLGAILKLNLVNRVDSGRFQTVSDIY